jgi:hypothetical protein
MQLSVTDLSAGGSTSLTHDWHHLFETVKYNECMNNNKTFLMKRMRLTKLTCASDGLNLIVLNLVFVSFCNLYAHTRLLTYLIICRSFSLKASHPTKTSSVDVDKLLTL